MESSDPTKRTLLMEALRTAVADVLRAPDIDALLNQMHVLSALYRAVVRSDDVKTAIAINAMKQEVVDKILE